MSDQCLQEAVSDDRRWRIQSLGESAICVTDGSPAPDDEWVVPAAMLQGAVKAERSRIVALVRDKAEGAWDPTVETVLRALADEITATAGGH